MAHIDKEVIEDLEEVLDDETQEFAGSIYGVLAEYRLHEKEPYIGVMVENGLENLKEFIINFLTQYLKD